MAKVAEEKGLEPCDTSMQGLMYEATSRVRTREQPAEGGRYDCGRRESGRAGLEGRSGRLTFRQRGDDAFYNCVFNLMDSLMHFAVHSSVRGRANDRGREIDGKGDEK